MRNRKWLALVVAGVTALTALLVVLSISVGQTTSTPGQKGQEEKAQQEYINNTKSTFPVVDYLQADIQAADRRAKSRKYGLISVLNPKITANSSEAIINEWDQGLTDLPIKESEVVVLGCVVGTHAYLSDNKQAVYSEFTISIEKIFKDETKRYSRVKDVITAERQGGIVRFPTGFEQWVFVVGQGMPVLNKRYVFFLSYEAAGLVPQKSDLSILTAYEISDGHIFPLDKPGAFYKGKSEAVLIGDLEKSLKIGSYTPPKKDDQQ